MRTNRKRISWRDWLKVGRLIPIVTVLVSLAVGILTLLKLFQATVAEGIIITLLALLATDALVERVNLLEKIETRVSALSASEQLRDRSDLVGIEEMAFGATEIFASGVTLVSLLATRYDFFAERMREGYKLRFLILDTNSLAMEVWMQGQRLTTPEDSQIVLRNLDNLMKLKTNGKCELRISKRYLPFSLVFTDPKKTSGRMNVEILASKVSLPSRPHIYLTKRDNEKWFDFFTAQFEQLWSESAKREVS